MSPGNWKYATLQKVQSLNFNKRLWSQQSSKQNTEAKIFKFESQSLLPVGNL